MDEDIIIEKMLQEMIRKSQRREESACPKGVVRCDREYFAELLHKCKVVLADFWAEWCGPCRMVEPIVEEVARKYASRITVAKVNVDENSDLAAEHGVLSIPTLIIFNNGREVKRLVGYYPGLARELFRTIESLIAD
ncbi:MAG: thioredoxin [Thermofilaceae archaeon]